MNERLLRTDQFARATGLPIDRVKNYLERGIIQHERGGFIGRNSDGQPMFRHLIPESEVERHRLLDVAPAEQPTSAELASDIASGRIEPDMISDPTKRREAVLSLAYAKRNQQAATDIGEAGRLSQADTKLLKAQSERLTTVYASEHRKHFLRSRGIMKE